MILKKIFYLIKNLRINNKFIISRFFFYIFLYLNIINNLNNKEFNNNNNNKENLKEEIELFELMNFVKNFVYSNWTNLNYKYKTSNIIIDQEDEEEYINDEEIFYRDILYI